MSNAIQIYKELQKKKVTKFLKNANLRSNSIFGKSTENSMSKANVKIVTITLENNTYKVVIQTKL